MIEGVIQSTKGLEEKESWIMAGKSKGKGKIGTKDNNMEGLDANGTLKEKNIIRVIGDGKRTKRASKPSNRGK